MRMREPFNGASHLLGLLVALYGASTLYHSLLLPERPLRALRTLVLAGSACHYAFMLYHVA